MDSGWKHAGMTAVESWRAWRFIALIRNEPILFQSRDYGKRAVERSGGRVSQAYRKEVGPNQEVPGSLGSFPRFSNSRLGTRGTSGNACLSLHDAMKVRAENIRNR